MEPGHIAEESLACSSAIPSRVLFSTRELGWSSLLIDQLALRLTGEEYQSRATPDQSLVLMTRGSLEIESCNSGRWQKAAYNVGTAGLTPGGKIDRLRRLVRRQGAPVEVLKIYLPRGTLQAAQEEYRRGGQPSLQQPMSALAFSDPAIYQVLRTAATAARAGASDLYAETTAHWLAVHLLAAHSPWLRLPVRERRPGALGDRRLARVVDYMSSHYAEPLNLDRLAREAGVSKFHFVRLFRLGTGVTPHRFLMDIRLDASRSMLLNSDRSVGEIAAACGYPRQSHFTAAFASRFRTTPSAMRGAPPE